MFSRILVALDGSEISRIAYFRALEFAREDNAELHAIIVVNSSHIWKDDSPANQTRTETDAKMLLDELENTQKRQVFPLPRTLSPVTRATESSAPPTR